MTRGSLSVRLIFLEGNLKFLVNTSLQKLQIVPTAFIPDIFNVTLDIEYKNCCEKKLDKQDSNEKRKFLEKKGKIKYKTWHQPRELNKGETTASLHQLFFSIQNNATKNRNKVFAFCFCLLELKHTKNIIKLVRERGNEREWN